MQRPAVVFPQPLSPTRPSTSPACDVERDPSTARTWPTVRENIPFLIGKYFFRSRTSRIGVAESGRLSRSDSCFAAVRDSACRAAISPARKQRDRCPSSKATSSGSSRQRFCATGTTRVKPASDGEVRRVRHAAGNHPEPVLRCPELRQRGLQARRVRVERAPERRAHVAVLDDLPRIHHGDAVGRFGHHAEVVRDQDDRHAELCLQPLQELEYLRLDGDVERGRRLVGDQHRRVGTRAPWRS